MKIGYMCSEFPGISHTFISREIEILEKEGFEVVTASINLTRNLEKMDPKDQLRSKSTYYVKSTSKLEILGALLGAAIRVPSFFRAFGFALGSGWFGGPRELHRALAYFIQAILVDRWAHSQGIRHLHVHFANPGSTVALFATKFGRLEFSMSVHGPDEFYDEERLLIREKVKAAVFVRCISYYCRSQMMRLVPSSLWSKFHIIRCGLYKDELVPRSAKAGPVRKILCVGRLCSNKGQAVLVRTAIELDRRGLDFQFLLLGGGEDLEPLRVLADEAGISGKFTLAGPVGHARVKEELYAADLFVLPSFAEGIPVALMEAMAAGVPVVSTAITGIPELIENGVNGFLTQPSNDQQLADLLEGLILGKVDTRGIVIKARETVLSTYDVERNTKQLGVLFAALEA